MNISTLCDKIELQSPVKEKVFAFAEGYCIITAMPLTEAMLIRDASMYLSIFMQTLIFAVLFILIFYLTSSLPSFQLLGKSEQLQR